MILKYKFLEKLVKVKTQLFESSFLKWSESRYIAILPWIDNVSFSTHDVDMSHNFLLLLKKRLSENFLWNRLLFWYICHLFSHFVSKMFSRLFGSLSIKHNNYVIMNLVKNWPLIPRDSAGSLDCLILSNLAIFWSIVKIRRPSWWIKYSEISSQNDSPQGQNFGLSLTIRCLHPNLP